MKSWGYVPSFEGLRFNYDADTIKSYLQDNNVVYVRGTTVVDNKSGGHAWVADGYEVRRTIFNVPGYYLSPVTYVHFNWGWGGRYNGYFSGSIYTPYEGCTYTSNEYSSFKIQY